MTITKTSVNYTISDSLENGWNISGNMSITESETSINLYIHKDSKEAEMHSEVGNYYWRKGSRVDVSFSITNDVDETEFLTICKKIVDEAVSKD